MELIDLSRELPSSNAVRRTTPPWMVAERVRSFGEEAGWDNRITARRPSPSTFSDHARHACLMRASLKTPRPGAPSIDELPLEMFDTSSVLH